MAIVGNHDGGRNIDVYYNNFLSRFNYTSLAYPKMSKTTMNTVYSFEYGNALFIVLNCMVYNNDLKAQWNYFIQTASAASKKKWKILVIHVPPYSPGQYFNIDNEHGKIITDAGIDLVISGHEQSYFRTTLHTTGTDNGHPEQTMRMPPDTGAGTTYVVAGTANNLYSGTFNWDADTSFNEIAYHAGESRSPVPGMYGKINVTDQYIEYTEYDTFDGSVVDTFTISNSREQFEKDHVAKLNRAAITGMPYVGNTLKALYTPSDVSVSFQWERSETGQNWSKIPNATSQTYTLTIHDVGHYIRCTILGTEDSPGELSSLPSKRVTHRKD